MRENKNAERGQLSIGSTWHKWDLHIHTPASIVHNYGNGLEQETWERFITDLESLPEEYAALGINDYLFLDGYARLLREQSENGRLTRFKLFPVVEFRIAKFAGVNFGALKRINLHVIFSDELDVETIKSQFLSGLEQSYTLEANGKKWTRAITRKSVSDLGAGIKAGVPAEEVKKYGPDLVEGFNNLNVDEQQIFRLLRERDCFTDKYIVAIGKTEWDALPWSDSSIATKKTIINDADLIFTAAENPMAWKAAKERLRDQNVKDLLLDCSDAHCFSDGEDKDRIGNCFTWIKADVTFEGLRQVLFEPDERLCVSAEDPREFQHMVVDSFQVTWLQMKGSYFHDSTGSR